MTIVPMGGWIKVVLDDVQDHPFVLTGMGFDADSTKHHVAFCRSVLDTVPSGGQEVFVQCEAICGVVDAGVVVADRSIVIASR